MRIWQTIAISEGISETLRLVNSWKAVVYCWNKTDSDSTAKLGVLTDSDGYFEFSLPEGKYELSVLCSNVPVRAKPIKGRAVPLGTG